MQKSLTIKAWWSFNAGQFNFGDEVNPYLIEKISGKQIQRVNKIPFYSLRKINICAGSVISAARRSCNVWGAGIIDSASNIRKANYYAVRGPLTQKRMTELGIKPPKTVGDPAVLLPLFYKPEVEKKYRVGLIPHIVDYKMVISQNLSEEVSIIDFTHPNIEEVIHKICECEYIISSSLHGIIVANAYGIPAVWVEFSNKLVGDGIKFKDYFASVGLPVNLSPIQFRNNTLQLEALNEITSKSVLPDQNIIKKIQKDLLDVCPFK